MIGRTGTAGMSRTRSRRSSRGAAPRALCVLSLLAGCGAPHATPGAPDLADEGGPDLAIPTIDLSGKFATRFSLQLTVDRGAGPKSAAADILAEWAALQPQGGGLAAQWELCTLPLPGIGSLPFVSLDTVQVLSDSLTLSQPTDGATVTQPEIAFVFGAHLADPARDPLPTDG